jgi:hypothetical protein
MRGAPAILIMTASIDRHGIFRGSSMILTAGVGMVCLAYATRSVAGLFLAGFFLLVGMLKTGRATNLILMAASLMLSLSIAEFTAGRFHTAPRMEERTHFSADSDYVKRRGDYRTMSDLGFLPLPGTYTSKKETDDGRTVYDVVYSIGEDRFRVTPQIRQPSQILINFFGCSFLFGEGLNDDETLPYFLNQADNRIAVKNYGMHGYGVYQALYLLETRKIEGQINFLLTAPWHAERSACVPVYGQGSPRYVLQSDGQVRLDGNCPAPDWDSWRARLLEQVNLYRQLRQFIRERSQDREIELYLALIDRLRALSRERGQRFMVGFIKANDSWYSGTYSNEKIQERLAAMGVELLDLTLPPTSHQIGKDYFIHDLDRHPSAKANKTRALLVKQYLEAHFVPEQIHTTRPSR